MLKIINLNNISYNNSLERFFELTNDLSLRENVNMKLNQLEDLINIEGRDLSRCLFEEHIKLSGPGDVGAFVIGSDEFKRTHKRVRKRILHSIFGSIKIERIGYSSRGTSSLFPKDAILNLPEESYSYGIQKLVAKEIARASFDEVSKTLHQITGILVPKRTLEILTKKVAIDFDEFYKQNDKSLSSHPLLILTTDGKGIVMRHKDLREATKQRAEKHFHKLKKRISKGEKANSKRMATVASVYCIDEFIRTPEDIINELNSNKAENKSRPKPSFKRTWASIEKSAEQVTKEIFYEAFQRDSKKEKQWICLIDGDLKQLKRIRLEAKKQSINLTIIIDIIHVIEYLWKAAHVFFKETDKEIEKWVNKRLLLILQGKASNVAAGIRRSATLKKLPKKDRIPIDKCSNYLLKNSKYLHYNIYLNKGFPIATGVIEGACRSLIKDRMDITGARWGLKGAEAVIKLRSLKHSGDFEKYWDFHLEQEYIRNHLSRYKDTPVLSN